MDKEDVGNSLVQWLGLRALTAEGLGSIPGQGTKSHKPCAQPKQTNKQTKMWYTYNEILSSYEKEGNSVIFQQHGWTLGALC